MAPFPEAEDMTVKRLYVALKRSDMQLLQMGAHKLHEKFHTGHKFELLDDLRQILSYVEEQDIPNDIKDLLTRTINDILNGTDPHLEEENQNADFTPFASEESAEISAVPVVEPQNSLENSQNNPSETENFVQDETKEEPPVYTSSEPVIFTPKEETRPENKYEEAIQQELSIPSTENEAVECEQNSVINKPEQNIEQAPEENREEQKPVYFQNKILEERKSELKNVAVFYDDKASFIDFAKNKAYRNELDLISLNKEAHPIENAAVVKSIVDIQTDEIGEILKMLNTIKGEVYFITTSKSENILKTFVENYVNFEIPLVSSGDNSYKTTKLIPLFGLSNIFICPKCGKREYFGGFHNKVLSLQCKNCNGVMYPDIYEAENFETNANPYYWIKAVNSSAKADTWILINPPLESTRSLTAEFIKTSFETAKPKKVYILSKETTKKEYYKQMFKEINPDCIIKTEFITQDSLCEDFINSEMSTLKVNI